MGAPLKTEMGQVSEFDPYEERSTEFEVSADVGEMKKVYKDRVVGVSAGERYRDEKCVNVEPCNVVGRLEGLTLNKLHRVG